MRDRMTRDTVKRIIKRQDGEEDIPLLFHKWWGQGLEEKYGDRLNTMAGQYPDDIHVSFHLAPGGENSPTGNPAYRWGYRAVYTDAERHGISNQAVLLPAWNELNDFLDSFPDPDEAETFDMVQQSLTKAGDRYRLGGWWNFLYERLWSIRGMENLMLDFYDEPDNIYLIGKRLIAYYKRIADRYAALGYDGIIVSDDLGHQTGPMMSPVLFKTLFQPLYREMADHLHSLGMDFFLHSCGDITELMPYLIEAGVDVIHPIQKGCMEYQPIADQFGDQISFMVGVDVQHLLPGGTAADIEAEIDSIVEIFGRHDGGLLLSAGNGILADTPIENIEVMLRRMSAGKLRLLKC